MNSTLALNNLCYFFSNAYRPFTPKWGVHDHAKRENKIKMENFLKWGILVTHDSSPFYYN